MLHHHNLEVTTVEANIYDDVTSQPRPSKPAPDATDMGILIETNSSPQKTSESHQPGGKGQMRGCVERDGQGPGREYNLGRVERLLETAGSSGRRKTAHGAVATGT